jgi:hypothetical protein
MTLVSHRASAYSMVGFLLQRDDTTHQVQVGMQVAWSMEPSANQWVWLPEDFDPTSIEFSQTYLFEVLISDEVHILKQATPLDSAIFDIIELGMPIKEGRIYDDFLLAGMIFGEAHKHVAWLGLHYQFAHPWWYHYELGWIYAEVVSPFSLWMWQPELGWTYVSANYYPWVWTIDDGWGYIDVQEREMDSITSPGMKVTGSLSEFDEV